IDIRSGQLRWLVDVNDQSEPDWWIDDIEWNFPLSWSWGPIAVHDGAIFMADRFLVTTTVTAFGLETGERLWEREIGTLNGSPVRQMNMVDGLLAVRIVEPSYSDLYVIDPSNGFRVFRENESASSLFWREEIEGFDRDYRAYSIGLEATTVNPWQFEFDNCGVTPQLLPDRIIVHALMCDESGRGGIFALDRFSGATLWRLDVPVVTQMAIDGAFGYVMDHDNQLLAIDMDTGAILSILRFNEPIRNFTPETPIFVGAGDGKTAVYYGMTNQLLFFDSAFKNPVQENN
ncbi:MAG: PQQ-binding-like beta-propeller repeat protein, partial [Chloroflexota bacterium]